MQVKNVQLTMTEAQAQTIMNALDFYSRVGIGQVSEMKKVMEENFNKIWNLDSTVDPHIEAVKKIYFPELSEGGYHSIFSSLAHEESKISWDLIQVIRHAIAWHKNPVGGLTVNFGNPHKSSLKEQLADVKINISGDYKTSV